MATKQGEAEAMTRLSQPATRASIYDDLQLLGVRPGMVLLVHASLSKIGWVNGGPVPVIQALMDRLTPDGTLIMPAFSADYSDPAEWQNPPAPKEWQETIRQTMPLFDPQRTPTREMGRIAELFRTWPDVQRSAHPQQSFAAWGRHAKDIVQGHDLAHALGDSSPLARIYERQGYILLLGVGFDRCSSMHLAEYRAPNPQPIISSVPWLVNGEREWQEFDDILFNDELFPQIGAAYESEYPVSKGQVGAALSRLIKQPDLVDFTQRWLEFHRKR